MAALGLDRHDGEGQGHAEAVDVQRAARAVRGAVPHLQRGAAGGQVVQAADPVAGGGVGAGGQFHRVAGLAAAVHFAHRGADDTDQDAAQLVDAPRDVVGDGAHVGRAVAGGLRLAGDLGDAAGDLARGVGGLVDVPADLLGRGGLFLHRGGDGGGNLIDLGDAVGDGGDGSHGAAGRGLDLADLGGDVLGRLRGLVRQILHLAGHHGEALAGFPGPCRLDGGVQRQKVGLAGDRLNELGDVTDLLHGVGQGLDGAARQIALLHGDSGDAAGLRHLGADLADRGGQFLRGGGDGLGVAQGLLRGGGHRLAVRPDGVRRPGHGGGVAFHLPGALGHPVHGVAGFALHRLGHVLQRVALGDLGLLALAFLLLAHALVLQPVGLEHLHRAGHRSDLVVPAASRHGFGIVATGDTPHRGGQAPHRADDAADHHHHAQQHHGDADGQQRPGGRAGHVVGLLGRLVILAGDAHLEVDQQADAVGDGVDGLIQLLPDEAVQRPAVLVRQDADQPLDQDIGLGHVRLDLVDEGLFLGVERVGQIGGPVRPDILLRLAGRRQAFVPGEVAVAGLVRGVDDEDGVGVRDDLQVAQRQHAFVMNRPQVGVRHVERAQPDDVTDGEQKAEKIQDHKKKDFDGEAHCKLPADFDRHPLFPSSCDGTGFGGDRRGRNEKIAVRGMGANGDSLLLLCTAGRAIRVLSEQPVGVYGRCPVSNPSGVSGP
ncbi:protein of unknown function [Azospirillum baldaniorum]|uniref:Uncharacterized protein n=1 Tax=Azospirillum baldaniorum TaxID=1064539 RepID=A0A9P1NLD1_9PROT|nr:protein of unknown function [Azospirillum baldaniorum]